LHDVRYTAEPAGVMIGGRYLSRAVIDQRRGHDNDPRGVLRWVDWQFAHEALRVLLSDPQQKALARLRETHQTEQYALTDSLGPLRSGMDGQVRWQRTLQLFARQVGELRDAMPADQRPGFDPKAREWLRYYAAQG